MEIYERSIDTALELRAPFQPIVNGAAPGSDTDLLPEDVTPDQLEIWGITAAFSSTTVLNLIVRQPSKSDLVIGINGSIPMAANNLHTFLFSVFKGASYNFQIKTNGSISYFIGTRARTGASH